MSLFKLRDWWSTKCGSDEEFDQKGLCVANLDNEASGALKIVTGSLHGFLRIFYPKKREFRIEDLMLEANLGLPILQLDVGRFIPNSSDLALAVLHPRKLTVYQVHSNSGIGDQGLYFNIERRYEHNLERTAANFTFGPFGGVSSRDFLCVQSMDGTLSVYEQDHFAFTRFLSPFLMPGPLCYLSKTDSFITVNSVHQVESYKYQNLASFDVSSQKPTDPNSTVKRLQADWTLNIGENALEIYISRFSRSLTSTQVDILVLGERTLFCIKENGAIRMQRKLDFHPSCYFPYSMVGSEEDPTLNNLMIASHLPSLSIYKDMQLIWATRIDSVPVALRVGKFGGLQGLIISLDEAGNLALSYLGTDPSRNIVNSPVESKDLNYEHMDKELRSLQVLIKESSTVVRTEPSEKIILRVQEETPLHEISSDLEDPTVNLGLIVTYTGSDELKNINIGISTPSAFKVSPHSVVLETISRESVIIPLVFSVRSKILPSSLTSTVVASYLTIKGEPRTARLEITLPLLLVCKVISPIKTSTYKIIFETNKKTVPLPNLFGDVATSFETDDSNPDTPNVLSFRYHCGPDVTVLGSKSGGKYRIQSSSFEAMWLLVSELVRRLTLFFLSESSTTPHSESEEIVQIIFNENLPFDEYFAIIDKHFEQRMSLAVSRQELQDRAEQFRAVQKRLLVRFKDRNAVPLQNMDVLLEGTYEQLNNIANDVQKKEKELREASNRLSSATQLMQRLIRYKLHLDDHNFLFLQNYLSSLVVDSDEQGWEESTDASLVQLLRTSLALSAQDAASLPQPLVAPSNTLALKQHIITICERLASGIRFPKPTTERKKKPSSSKEGASAPSKAPSKASSKRATPTKS